MGSNYGNHPLISPIKHIHGYHPLISTTYRIHGPPKTPPRLPMTPLRRWNTELHATRTPLVTMRIGGPELQQYCCNSTVATVLLQQHCCNSTVATVLLQQYCCNSTGVGGGLLVIKKIKNSRGPPTSFDSSRLNF